MQEEYTMKCFMNNWQIIYVVFFLEHSWNIPHVRPSPNHPSFVLLFAWDIPFSKIQWGAHGSQGAV